MSYWGYLTQPYLEPGAIDNSPVCRDCHYGDQARRLCLIIAARNTTLWKEFKIARMDGPDAARIKAGADAQTIVAEHPVPKDCPKEIGQTVISQAAVQLQTRFLLACSQH